MAAAVALAGCTGEEGARTSPSAAPAATGYFVGAGSGVGAVVDLAARDAGASAVRRAFGHDRTVAVAAVVNRGETALRMPTFRAFLDDGAAFPLMPVSPPRTRDGPPAPPPQRLPVGGARTLYLVFPAGAATRRVAAVQMSLDGESVATLRSRPR